jgi:hypothetical protein
MQVEFTNWGEPLLAKEFPLLVQAAVRRGLSTTTSSSLSLPMGRERAEALVESGLHVLGVSIDGARQESYEAYRVRGDLETVLANCRLINEAKQRLRSQTPALVWEFHVFPHNVGDVEQARAMAAELGMQITVSKGWVVGPEWKSADDLQFYLGNPEVFPCLFLWQYAVVNNDGGRRAVLWGVLPGGRHGTARDRRRGTARRGPFATSGTARAFARRGGSIAVVTGASAA